MSSTVEQPRSLSFIQDKECLCLVTSCLYSNIDFYSWGAGERGSNLKRGDAFYISKGRGQTGKCDLSKNGN
jgi:hypothetical protein